MTMDTTIPRRKTVRMWYQGHTLPEVTLLTRTFIDEYMTCVVTEHGGSRVLLEKEPGTYEDQYP